MTVAEVSPHFVRAEGRDVLVIVDLSLYSLDALKKTAHRFTGRCAVHLQHEDETHVTVRLHLLREGVDGSLVAGEFVNALLDQTLREEIGLATEPVRNLILAHALSQTNLLSPELEEVEPHHDPLGIAQPDN